MTRLEKDNFIAKLHSDKDFFKQFKQDRFLLNFEVFRNKYGFSKSFYFSEIYPEFEELHFSEEDKQNKREKTCMERLGTKTPFHSKQVIEKRKQNYFKKYGVENPFQNEEVKQKIKETHLEKLGVEYPMQSEEIRNKSIESCKKIYGTENVSQNSDIKKKKRKKLGKKYLYNNLSFDSSWELCYYIYCIENNFDIIREPFSLTYFIKNKEHLYFPDFLVNGELIEIKALWKLTEDFKLINESEKQKCMEDNNVKIITYPEITKYIKYVEEKYGKDFIQSTMK